jgi:hypothetical protein
MRAGAKLVYGILSVILAYGTPAGYSLRSAAGCNERHAPSAARSVSELHGYPLAAEAIGSRAQPAGTVTRSSGIHSAVVPAAIALPTVRPLADRYQPGDAHRASTSFGSLSIRGPPSTLPGGTS